MVYSVDKFVLIALYNVASIVKGSRKMLNKLKNVFKSSKAKEEEAYLLEHAIQFDSEQGYIVDGIILNKELSERLEYYSNRRLTQFDDLQALYYAAMLINEKIDLEIAQQRFVARLGNTEENLVQFKQIVQKLNDYYRNFIREK
jgi:hypothetical protein